mmetsp:Transcript_14361/g.16515  ORF Transcript_14361/g.16515 Transcript_14361/m.16515 type:complete len:1049 (+) Transcript_14361:310-3456(+)
MNRQLLRTTMSMTSNNRRFLLSKQNKERILGYGCSGSGSLVAVEDSITKRSITNLAGLLHQQAPLSLENRTQNNNSDGSIDYLSSFWKLQQWNHRLKINNISIEFMNRNEYHSRGFATVPSPPSPAQNNFIPGLVTADSRITSDDMDEELSDDDDEIHEFQYSDDDNDESSEGGDSDFDDNSDEVNQTPKKDRMVSHNYKHVLKRELANLHAMHIPSINPPTSDTNYEQQNNANNNQYVQEPDKTSWHNRKRREIIHHNEIPKQTLPNSYALFDALAPHIEFKSLKTLSKHMQNFCKAQVKANQEISSNSNKRKNNSSLLPLTLVYRVQRYFDDLERNSSLEKDKKSKSGKRTIGKLPKNKKSQEEHSHAPWVKTLLTYFLAGMDVSTANKGFATQQKKILLNTSITTSTHTTASSLSKVKKQASVSALGVWNEPHFPPNYLNSDTAPESSSKTKTSLQTNQELLVSVRKLFLDKHIRWNAHKRNRKNNKERIAGQRTNEHWEALKLIIDERPHEELLEEADEMASLLADRLPLSVHKNLLSFLRKQVNRNEQQRQGTTMDNINNDDEIINSNKNKLDRRYNRGKNKVIHSQEEKMMYQISEILGFHLHLVIHEICDYLHVDMPPSPIALDPFTKQPIIMKAEAADNNTNNTRNQNKNTILQDPLLVESWTNWNDAREDLSRIFLEAQILYAENPPRLATPISRFDEMAETIAELDTLRKRDDGVLIGKKKTRPTSKVGSDYGIGTHAIYDALMLSTDLNRSLRTSSMAMAVDQHQQEKQPQTRSIVGGNKYSISRHQNIQHVVYLENLPIDMTNENLTDMFQKSCGPISSLEIYNQRPEIDPGPLSAKKKMALKKQQKQNYVNGRQGKTPVYAVIEFETQKGFDKATRTDLLIFGMVIQRHLVKTRFSKAMTSLFLEDIPPSVYSLDLEYTLSKLLHPYIYISLRGGQHDFSQPKSLEIKFPNHETALFAYDIIKTKLELDLLGLSSAKEAITNDGADDDDCVDDDDDDDGVDNDDVNQEIFSRDVTLNWIRTPKNAIKYWTRELEF